MKRSDDARSLIRGLIHTSTNLRPDPAAGVLNVELHGQANPAHDAIVASIFEELNTTATTYPGTGLRLKFTPIRSSVFPAGQDVRTCRDRLGERRKDGARVLRGAAAPAKGVLWSARDLRKGV